MDRLQGEQRDRQIGRMRGAQRWARTLLLLSYLFMLPFIVGLTYDFLLICWFVFIGMRKDLFVARLGWTFLIALVSGIIGGIFCGLWNLKMEVMIETHDPNAIGIMLDGLALKADKLVTNKKTLAAVLALLPRLQADDLDLLTGKQRERLYRLLQSNNCADVLNRLKASETVMPSSQQKTRR